MDRASSAYAGNQRRELARQTRWTFVLMAMCVGVDALAADASLNQTGGPETSAYFPTRPAATQGTSADLYLEFEGGFGQIRPGAEIAYDLFVFNGGPSSATAAFIEIPLPAATTFVAFDRLSGTSPPWPCTTPSVGAGGTVRCELAQYGLASGAFFRLKLRANPNTVGVLVTTTATIGASTFDPDLSDNYASAVSLVQAGTERADVSVSIESSTLTVAPGGTLTQTAFVTNHGPEIAVSGGVSFTLDADAESSVSTPPEWQCEYLPPPPDIFPYPLWLMCRIPVLPVGISEFRFVSRVAQNATRPVVLSAQAGSATLDTNPTNNTATATVRIGVGVGVAVPVLSPALLAFLALMLATIGLRASARRN